MEVQEQETGILSDEDFLLVEHLTGELISRALDLCDEKVNSFDEIIESGSYLPPWVDRNVEDVVNKITASSKNKKPKFSSSENLMVRSNSVDVSLTCLQTSNPGEDCVTPSWRRSLRRTMSEAALSLVDEGVEVEYLEHFDPFKGNFDVVSQVGEVLATSANKHPAEQTSFLQALQEMSLGSCYETPNSVGLNCADSDEVDDTDDVDGGFACKTQAMAEGEDGLTECMTPQNPLVLTSEISGIHNSNMPYSFSVGLSNSSESCSVDTDVENHGSLPVDLGNSMKRTNHTSEDDKKFCVQDFNEDRILNSASLKTADFDCRSNIVITKSEIDEYAPHNHTDDRVTDDTSDRVTDDSSDRVTDDSNDRVTDDTNDRGTDDTTSDRMTDDSNDRVTVDTNNRVTDDVNDRVTDDTSNRVTDDTNDRVTDDSNDRMTDDANDRVTDDTNDRVTDDSNDRVTDDSNDRVTDDTNDRVTDDTTDRVIDDIVESSSPSCLLNVHAEKDTSTCNCISSTTLQSDQDTFCKPALSHITPNSVISDTADVSIADRSPDLRVADTNQVQPLDLNETVSDGDEVGNLSFLSTDTEGDFSSFSAAEKFVREVLSRSRSSSSTSSPKKSSSGAAINADSRMYNTLTFLDNDDSDDGDGEVGKNKSTTEAANGSEKLDNHKHPASDVNDNPPEADEENGSVVHPADSDPTVAKKKIVPNLELLTCDDLDLNFSPRGDSVPDLHLGDYYNDHTPDDLVSPDDLANPVFDSIDDWADDPDEPPVEPIPEYTAREEYEDVRNWRPVQIAGISYRIDMRAIEPYKKVLSHGGLWSVGHELALDELEIIP